MQARQHNIQFVERPSGALLSGAGTMPEGTFGPTATVGIVRTYSAGTMCLTPNTGNDADLSGYESLLFMPPIRTAA